MKYILVSILLLGASSAQAQETIKLEIYHTNDMHSRVEPFPSDYGNRRMADKAGLVRRVTLMKQEREKDPELLLFDCGDFSQGSPYYNLFKGSTEVEFMNLCGYDAGIIGNHEFDFGEDNMHRIFQEAQFPIVCANYTVQGTPLENDVKPYVILHRKGLKIGVFGLSPQPEGLVQSKNYRGMEFLNPIETANTVARQLKEKEKCDVVICLSHLGWDASEKNPFCDQNMIKNTRNIDLVLGGHSHTYFEQIKFIPNLDGKEIPVNQMGKNAQWIGHVTLTFTSHSQP